MSGMARSSHWQWRVSPEQHQSKAAIGRRDPAVGWRDAEIPERNLKGIILSNPDDNDRGAWSREQILKALWASEPNTWASWVYLIGLATGVRIGYPMAARVGWFDPKSGMIEVNNRKFTK
jgi:hypothetical protein